MPKLNSIRYAAVLVFALAAGGCSDGPAAPPQAEITPASNVQAATPGPGEECFPEQHGPTCVANANSRTGYAIAN